MEERYIDKCEYKYIYIYICICIYNQRVEEVCTYQGQATCAEREDQKIKQPVCEKEKKREREREWQEWKESERQRENSSNRIENCLHKSVQLHFHSINYK